MTYLYLEQVNSARTKNELYTKHKSGGSGSCMKFRLQKLSSKFVLLPDSVAAGLGIMKPEIPATAVVELDKQGHVLESRPHTKTPFSSHVNTTYAVLRQAHFGSVTVATSTSALHERVALY